MHVNHLKVDPALAQKLVEEISPSSKQTINKKAEVTATPELNNISIK